jgi:hypothetical protein
MGRVRLYVFERHLSNWRNGYGVKSSGAARGLLLTGLFRRAIADRIFGCRNNSLAVTLALREE